MESGESNGGGGARSALYITTLAENIWMPFAAMLESAANLGKEGEQCGLALDKERPGVDPGNEADAACASS